jgi:hypothetical protein
MGGLCAYCMVGWYSSGYNSHITVHQQKDEVCGPYLLQPATAAQPLLLLLCGICDLYCLVPAGWNCAARGLLVSRLCCCAASHHF